MSNQKHESSYVDKRVLITGVDGFIGSHLARVLAACGAEVHGTVHAEKKIPEIARFFQGDLSSATVAQRILEESRPTIVFNTASTVDTSRSFEILDEVLAHTYGIARHVLEASAAAGVEKYIQFGSIDEYGFNDVPFRERMHEQPFSPYSLGKVLATNTTLAFGRMTNMRVSVVRPAATYGPGKQGLLISNIIKAGLEKKSFDMNPGEQRRDLVYIDDLVEGVLAVGASEQAAGEIFNLGSGQGYKMKDVANMVNAAMGNPITINFGAKPYRPLDFMEFYMDSSKAKETLGWEATTALEEGIAKTVAWAMEHVV